MKYKVQEFSPRRTSTGRCHRSCKKKKPFCAAYFGKSPKADAGKNPPRPIQKGHISLKQAQELLQGVSCPAQCEVHRVPLTATLRAAPAPGVRWSMHSDTAPSLSRRLPLRCQCSDAEQQTATCSRFWPASRSSWSCRTNDASPISSKDYFPTFPTS